MEKNTNFAPIPKEKFVLVGNEGRLHDKQLPTKQMSYFQDVFRRFCRNKSSVVAAVIIGILVLFAIIGPFCGNDAYTNSYATETMLVNYKQLRPRIAAFDGSGFWDGSKTEEISEARYNIYRAMEQEMGSTIIQKVYGKSETTDPFGKVSVTYKVRVQTYHAITVMKRTLTAEQYEALQSWQLQTGIQVILPWVDETKAQLSAQDASIWFVSDRKGRATRDADGNLIPAYVVSSQEKDEDNYHSLRLEGDPYTEEKPAAGWRYAKSSGSNGGSYTVRVDPYNYFYYTYQFEPSFVFGTDTYGYDIFTRLANGARFSFLLAIGVSALNLIIGAIYGAIEGYYGGWTDIIMERISDILGGIPFTVVTILFSLHLAHRVGTVPALLLAFVSTGWLGMAARVRMQFYRFKNQEYVLAARTLGAKDTRVMFKHIFPNSLGTIITGSILAIPGVIFSETSLTYLGIINLDSAGRTSIGAMLSAGQACMTVAPHVVLFPAIFIALLEISFNLVGNGLRDAFNPATRGVNG